MKQRLQQILLFALSALAAPLFFLSLHVAIGPTGHLFMAFSSRSLIFAGIGLVLSAAPLGLASIAIFTERQTGFAEQMQRISAPLLLLYAYPLAIILHPLGIPRPVFALFQPRIILFFAVSIMALIFLKAAMAPFLPIMQRRLTATSSTLLAWLLFLIFCSFYAIMIHQNDRVQRLVGDEPHYLMIMESLRRYRTADLLPLVESEDPLPHGIRIVNLHTSSQTRPGTRYEVHNIGNAIAMLPAFHLFGYRGALGIFALFTAFMISNLYLLCEDITRQKILSWSIAAIVGFSAPFFFYFRFIYPEIPATACALFAFRILRKHKPTTIMLFLAGAAAAALPWFHAKFTVMAATLMLLALWLQRGSWKRICTFAVPLIPSAILLMGFFYHAYGSWLPNAQYGSEYKTINAFFFRGSLGLLMDPDNGLIPFAPLYILAFPGMILLWKENRAYCVQALLFTVPSFIIVSSHWMWWGGPCPPARFIIPLIPFYVPGIVTVIKSSLRLPKCRILCLLLILATLAISYVSLRHVDNLHAPRNFLRDQFLSMDAYFPFPSFYIHRSQPVPGDRFSVAAVWLLLFFGLILVFRHSAKKVLSGNRTSILFAFLLFLAIPGGIGLLSEVLGGRTLRVRDGSEVSFAKLNHLLDAFYRPLERSRMLKHDNRGAAQQPFPITLKVGIPIDREVVLTEALFEPGHPDRWLYFGQYTRLFPAIYTATLNMSAAPIAPEKPAICFDVVSLKGRISHIQKHLLTDTDSNTPTPNSFVVEPQKLLTKSEFRIAALQPGKYQLQDIQLSVTIR